MLDVVTMQQFDATFLLAISASMLVIICEDKRLPSGMRLIIALIGFLSFAQAMWLLGIWMPGAAGYPWPRMTLDGALCAASLLRAFNAVMASIRQKRASRSWRPYS